jgi:hypothetical protein
MLACQTTGDEDRLRHLAFRGKVGKNEEKYAHASSSWSTQRSRTLELRDLSQDCQPAFWDALLGFRNLRSLALTSKTAFGTDSHKFWQICTHLERLHIFMTHTDLKFISLQGEYPNMKDLTLFGCRNALPLLREIS